MKKIFLLNFLNVRAGVLLFIFLAFPICVQAQDADFNRDFSSVRTIESSFKMERYVSIAKEPFISAGKFSFKKPDYLKWEYITPFHYGFISDGGKTVSFQVSDDETIENKDVSDSPFAAVMAQQLRMFISMDQKEISKNYFIQPFENGVELSPKDNSKKQLVKNIKIYFDETKPVVKEVEILNKNGDKTIIKFENAEIATGSL